MLHLGLVIVVSIVVFLASCLPSNLCACRVLVPVASFLFRGDGGVQAAAKGRSTPNERASINTVASAGAGHERHGRQNKTEKGHSPHVGHSTVNNNGTQRRSKHQHIASF